MDCELRKCGTKWQKFIGIYSSWTQPESIKMLTRLFVKGILSLLPPKNSCSFDCIEIFNPDHSNKFVWLKGNNLVLRDHVPIFLNRRELKGIATEVRFSGFPVGGEISEKILNF